MRVCFSQREAPLYVLEERMERASLKNWAAVTKVRRAFKSLKAAGLVNPTARLIVTFLEV